ncbi:restriction endonuclease [Nocardia sp. CA-128927]|uniref:restriction endonuclease n=1 Tax=Nocardia sp. CA-128927 TaxID=3239975 RepID=UPI003D9825CA
MNATSQMRSLGYRDAQVTARGADSGIDVRATGAVAQVKWRTAQAGRPDLQRLFGARGMRLDLQMLFFAASGYSAHAVDYADAHDIALFTYLPNGTITPINIVAKHIAGARDREQTPRQRPATSAELPELTEERLAKLIAKNRNKAHKRGQIAQRRSGASNGHVPVASAALHQQRSRASRSKAVFADTRHSMHATAAANQAIGATGGTPRQPPARGHVGHLVLAVLNAVLASMLVVLGAIGNSIGFAFALVFAVCGCWQYREYLNS